MVAKQFNRELPRYDLIQGPEGVRGSYQGLADPHSQALTILKNLNSIDDEYFLGYDLFLSMF